MLKRIAKIAAATAMLASVLSAAASETGAVQEGRLPAYSQRFSREKPIVAVVAENEFTELTDYVVPFGVLSESGVADVHALATKEGPVQLFPAFRVQPQATTAQFDARFPEGADYVIVPAVHRVNDTVLVAWIKSQASKGAVIVGVCDGVWVTANAGLLQGKKAVGHWYSVDDLRSKFPGTEFVENRRFLSDGNVITTTGVTASIPVSIAIVEAIAGQDRATELAKFLGVKDWGTLHHSEDFKLNFTHILTAAVNWLAFWRHEDIEIPVRQGIDEIALALVADAYSRTYRSTAYAWSATADPVSTRNGLVLYPDKVGEKSADRSVELPAHVPATLMFDTAIREISNAYGTATSEFVSLQMEYPKP